MYGNISNALLLFFTFYPCVLPAIDLIRDIERR